jgi:5-methyltetrahydrofolate--homocysteine methyltransferase
MTNWIPVTYGHHPLVAARARELRRSMTRAEHILWDQLRRDRFAGLRFRRQHPMDGYIADFFCHQMRLIVEVDGEVHERQREYDALRNDHFESQGYRVLRFTNPQVLRQTRWVVDQIEQAMRERCCSPDS